MLFSVTIVLINLVGTVLAQCQSTSSFKYAPTFSDGTSGRVIYNGLVHPRAIKFDTSPPTSSSNLLVIDVGVGLLALTPTNDSGCNGWDKKVLVENKDFNHGLEVGGGKVYASTSDVVYAYAYDAGNASVSGDAQTVVKNMDNSDHNTRTLLLSPNASNPTALIINRGSASNVDTDAATLSTGRSQIRRFNLTSIPSGGYNWSDGELLSWGMRNGVGISLSEDGTRVWEVENSADDVQYEGVDVHEDNPAEELNMIDLLNSSSLGAYYGYPNCFTVWDFKADNAPANLPTGAQFSIGNNGSRDDAWCQSTSNVIPPRLSFQAHSAPLDIKFFPSSSNDTSLSSDWKGDAFVSFHGSWDRTKPTGYGVVRIPWGDNQPTADSSSQSGYSFIMQAPDLSQCNDKCIRPVGLAFGGDGRLYGSSDATGEIFVIEGGSSASSALEANTKPLTSSYWPVAVGAGLVPYLL